LEREAILNFQELFIEMIQSIERSFRPLFSKKHMAKRGQKNHAHSSDTQF